MDSTALGMVMEVSPVQPRKAYSPMAVTVLGMTVFMQPVISLLVAVSMMALQLLGELYTVLLVFTVIDSRELQSLNGLVVPIFVTEAGITMEVKPVFQKALLPMDVNELGNSMVVKLVQLWKA